MPKFDIKNFCIFLEQLFLRTTLVGCFCIFIMQDKFVAGFYKMETLEFKRLILCWLRSLLELSILPKYLIWNFGIFCLCFLSTQSSHSKNQDKPPNFGGRSSYQSDHTYVESSPVLTLSNCHSSILFDAHFCSDMKLSSF